MAVRLLRPLKKVFLRILVSAQHHAKLDGGLKTVISHLPLKETYF